MTPFIWKSYVDRYSMDVCINVYFMQYLKENSSLLCSDYNPVQLG